MIEESMFPIMYELPDRQSGQRYVMTDKMIRGEEPMFTQDDSAAA